MDAIKEIWASLIDRIRNPLLTGFVLSWCVINYKLLVVLLADEHYQKKFEFIEHTLYTETNSALWNLIGIPAVASVVYVFILPGIALLSTWATSTYERLHSDVRTAALKKLTLSAEQRDQVQREASLIVEKAQKEAQEAIAARIDTSRTTRDNVIKLFNALLPNSFENLKVVAPNWQGPVKKAEHGRTVGGTKEQNEFVAQYGIPEKWSDLFMAMRSDDSTRINSKEAAKRLQIGEDEALRILVGLCALAMLELDWVDNTPFFSMKESSWVALLNGRPA